MRQFKHICGIVLLYGTILYAALYVMAAESLAETHPTFAIIGFFVLIVLIVICSHVFDANNIDEYIPKWLQ